MKSTTLNSNKTHSNSYVALFLLISVILFPVSYGGYTSIYIIGIFSIFLLYFAGYRFVLSISQLTILFFFIIALSSISMIVNSIQGSDLWALREFIRIPTLILFFYIGSIRIANSTNIETVILKALFFIITLDILIFFIFTDIPFVFSIKQSMLMPGMNDYGIQFWRHIGILGNPNSSAFIYALTIIFCVNYLNTYQKKLNYKLFIVFIGLLTCFYLLYVSMSRTGYVSLLLALAFFINFRSLLVIISFSIIFGILFGSFYEISWIQAIMERFESTTAIDARFSYTMSYLNSFDIATIFFGQPLLGSVVDNDYIYIFFRFGIILGLIIILLPMIIFFGKNSKKLNRKLILSIFTLFYLYGFTGGSFTQPKIYILFAIIMILLKTYYIRVNNAD